MLETAAPTVAELLREGRGYLAAFGLSRPAWETACIWSVAGGRDLTVAWLDRAESSDNNSAARFREALERRAAGEPLSYVVGTAGFRTLEVEVSSDVLIPRPETEGLVELVLEWGRGLRGANWGTALDVGTGSGCIALSLAVEGRFSAVVATDCSRAALRVAQRNAEVVDATTPVRFVQADLFDSIRYKGFDLVVSNPPYLTDVEFEEAEPSVRAYEPRIALASGVDGMWHTHAILENARWLLKPGGLLALEIDSSRSETARSAALEAGWRDVIVEADVFGRARYLVASVGG